MGVLIGLFIVVALIFVVDACRLFVAAGLAFMQLIGVSKNRFNRKGSPMPFDSVMAALDPALFKATGPFANSYDAANGLFLFVERAMSGLEDAGEIDGFMARIIHSPISVEVIAFAGGARRVFTLNVVSDKAPT